MIRKLLKIWPLAVIVIIWLVLFWPFFSKKLFPIPSDIITGVYYPWLDYKWGFSVGVPVKNPLMSDVPSLLYPWRSFALDEIKAGHWPLWNPYYFAGMPLLANFQSAVFSYANIFFLFFSKAIAWSLGVMLSPLLTMLAMYVFLRHKKLQMVSSLLGSIVFSLSGFEIAWMEYNVLGHTALLLPLILLAIDKIFAAKNNYWMLLLPVLLAMQIFTGYIPVVIYTYLICLFYILFLHFLPKFKKRKIEWRRFLTLGFAWVMGWGLSAIQLLPGYELIKNSIRRIDPIVGSANASFFPPKNLATFLAPDYFGNPATGNYFGGAYYDNYFAFVGTLTLIFIFFSLILFRKERTIRFWWLILCLSLVLIFKNPVGLALEKLFFLSGGVASRALFITDFSLAILAAWGLEVFLKKKERRWQYILITGGIFLSFLVLGAVSFSWPISTNRLVTQRNLIIPFGVFLLGMAILLLDRLTKNKYRSAAGGIIVFLIASQLLYGASKYLPFSKKELLFPSTPLIDFLQQKTNEVNEPVRTEIADVIPQNFLMVYKLSTTSGYDALLPQRMGEFLSLIETGKVMEKISRVHLIRNFDSPFYPLLSTKYILAKKTGGGTYLPAGTPPKMFSDSRYKLIFEDKSTQVYEDNRSLPAAFWTHEYRIAQSQEQFFDVGQPPPFAFFKTIVLETKPELTLPQTPARVNKIEWLKFEPGMISLLAESDQPGWVFISQNKFPGWEAKLDGKTVEIIRANYTFMAIEAKAGKHQIVLEYKPKSFYYGKLISLISLLGLVFSYFFAKKLPLFNR